MAHSDGSRIPLDIVSLEILLVLFLAIFIEDDGVVTSPELVSQMVFLRTSVHIDRFVT